ncbi:MAG: hypothetical protein Kow0075_10280 [Salibacteraceae bacterium]
MLVRYIKQFDGFLLLLGPISMFFVVLVRVSAGVNEVDLSQQLTWLLDQNTTLVIPGWVDQLAGFLVSLGFAVLINRRIQQWSLQEKLNNMPFFVIIWVFTIIPGGHSSVLYWLSSVLYLAYLNQVFGLIDGLRSVKSVFNASLLTGVLTLINGNFIWLLPLLWWSAISNGELTLRKWLLSLIGVALPHYFLLALGYLFFDRVLTPHLPVYTIMISWNSTGFWILSLYMVVAVVAAISIVRLQSGITLRLRKKLVFIYTCGMLTLLVAWLSGMDDSIYFFIVPATILLSRFLTEEKSKWLSELTVLALILIPLFLLFTEQVN